MKRHSRVLRPNHSTEAPSQLIFLDTETYPTPSRADPHIVSHRFRLGCATRLRLDPQKVTRRATLDFRELSDFWAWVDDVLSKERPCWLFAHNLGFDLTICGFWEMLQSGWCELKSLCSEDPPTIVRCTRNGCKLVMVDTLNYWRMSLADLAPHFGQKKMPMPDFSRADDEWFRYCRNDVDCIEAAILTLLRWHRRCDLGVFRTTAPGIAFQAYRHRFMTEQIVLPVSDRQMSQESEGYYGGQCEAFYIGQIEPISQRDKPLTNSTPERERGRIFGPVYSLDVNGLFPFAMAKDLYPVRTASYVDAGDVKQLLRQLGTYGGIAQVELNTATEVYPLRKRGETLYPRGKFRTVLAGRELERALQQGDVVSVGWVLLYEMADLFGDFVSWFWAQRQAAKETGDAAADCLAKLMVNSLYGKFGQRAFAWVEDKSIPVEEDWGEWWYTDLETNKQHRCRNVGGLVQRHVEEGFAEHSFPAIAAFVTASAREHMRMLRSLVPVGHLYYQAIDALHVSATGRKALEASGWVHPTDLGCMKLQDTWEWVEYRGQNNYSVPDAHKIAGLKGKPRQVGPMAFEVDTFDRLGAVLARDPDRRIDVVTMRKNFAICHPRGILDDNGWVRPLIEGV